MPRSPSDATRFTATSPHHTSNPHPSSPGTFTSATTPTSNPLHITPGTSGPANETPQQKIARLRAAAALAKRSTETSFDRTVRLGRVWADRAHRLTTFGLIGLTVLSGAVATAGITDMLIHNRRRRNEWLAEKQAQTAREIDAAREAVARGTVSEEQALLLNRERAKEEADREKRERGGVVKRLGGLVFGGVEKEEVKGGRIAGGVGGTVAAREDGSVVGEQGEFVLEPASVVEGTPTPLESAFGSTQTAVVRGGPLDQQAQAVYDSATATARSWTSWFSRR